jgi:hypothetical protein
MKLFPSMYIKRCNRFHVCSASDKMVSEFAQHALGCPCKNSQNLNAGWTYDKIHSAKTQCAMKLFPYMLSRR